MSIKILGEVSRVSVLSYFSVLARKTVLILDQLR